MRVSLEFVLRSVSMIELASELIVESALGVIANSFLEYSNSVDYVEILVHFMHWEVNFLLLVSLILFEP